MEPRPIESVQCIGQQQFVEVAAVDSFDINDERDRDTLSSTPRRSLLDSTRVDTSHNSNHRAVIDRTFDIYTQEW